MQNENEMDYVDPFEGMSDKDIQAFEKDVEETVANADPVSEETMERFRKYRDHVESGGEEILPSELDDAGHKTIDDIKRREMAAEFVGVQTIFTRVMQEIPKGPDDDLSIASKALIGAVQGMKDQILHDIAHIHLLSPKDALLAIASSYARFGFITGAMAERSGYLPYTEAEVPLSESDKVFIEDTVNGQMDTIMQALDVDECPCPGCAARKGGNPLEALKKMLAGGPEVGSVTLIGEDGEVTDLESIRRALKGNRQQRDADDDSGESPGTGMYL